MLNFRESETGYYEDEEQFYELDAYNEAAEERAYGREIEGSHGCEFDEPLNPNEAVLEMISRDHRETVDPETGCTAAEMKEEEVDWVPWCPATISDTEQNGAQLLIAVVDSEGKAA